MSHSHYNELAMHSDSPVREANLENNFNEEPKVYYLLLIKNIIFITIIIYFEGYSEFT
jgi:hypothetical protein